MNRNYDYMRDSDRASSRFLTGVFGWMFIGLVISGFSAVFAAMNFKSFMFLGTSTYYFYIIAEVLLVLVLSSMIEKLNRGAAAFLFVTYAAVNGITLSTIFFVYNMLVIAETFAVCAVMFLGMIFYGLFTGNNLARYRTFFVMALWGLIAAGFINWLSARFFYNGAYNLIDLGISSAFVVIFAGLTAYDTQKMLYVSRSSDDSERFAKYSIKGALELYLDFINMFLYLLRIFGRRK